mgnify:CR=1 FL=1
MDWFLKNDKYNTNNIQGVDVTFDLVVIYSLIEDNNNQEKNEDEKYKYDMGGETHYNYDFEIVL